MTALTVTIRPGTTIGLLQIKEAGLSEAATDWIFTELCILLGEPGEHTLELPPELKGQGAAIKAVVRVLL
ncbi:MAG: hypothetical protein V7742_21240 [Halioglobus sp.]